MAEISGTLTSEYARLGDLLSKTLDSGEDVGASVSVTVEGETVVDIWGGWADEAQTTPWGRDTITNVWSTTKTMTFLSTLVLAERGLLGYHEKVSTYWPEFAQNGKADIEVRHLMGHTSGVSAWEQPVAVEDIYNWEKSTSMLAAQAPWWTPGEGSGYHPLNQGHLLGEVIRRIDGRMLGQFFADEIAGPLDADFHIGLDPSEFDRVSNVIPPPALAIDMSTMDPDSVLIKTFTG
ncbi:MAG: serine hydrolase, partial [Ilumatobacter sp.]|nr:serine hydrolase [Ilumatobacter sp.]